MNDVFGAAGVNLAVVLPELLIVVFAMLVMLADMFTSDTRPESKVFLPWVALAGVIITIVVCLQQWNGPVETFQELAINDHFALGLRLIVLIATGLAILLSAGYIHQVNSQTGEYYALLLLCAAGMMAMGSATDLIVVFLALEIFSLGLYILSGLNRRNPRSTEAGMKYFLLGAFVSAFFVYGAALLYGATGSTQYDAIAQALANGTADMSLLYPAIALLVVGFGFKVSLAPFHMWTPDVYQGAPTPVTAFMSVGTKAAAFAAFTRVLLTALPDAQPTWSWALAILAILTMTVGNLAALRQTSLKRMLAYSSIAHAGYVLVGLTAGTTAGADAALFYLFTYAFMNIGAFAVVMVLEKTGENDALQNRAAGLADRWPLLALVMAIFMSAGPGWR
jgi:NADH-quinone oxidoreductase subunit N